MKKVMAALLLSTALTLCNVAAAEEYIMSPGDQLYIFVQEYPDINGPQANSNVYQVRPDGNLNFPLVGDIDTKGKTVKEFMAELKERLKEYVIEPTISVNLQQLGTTRVLVLGEVKRAGLFELTKSHRVADAIGMAGGFTDKAAKKRVYLVRNGDKDNVQKLDLNGFLRKGDLDQNVVLNEGDCLYLTSNHKLSLQDIMLFVNRGMSAWYNGKRAKDL